MLKTSEHWQHFDKPSLKLERYYISEREYNDKRTNHRPKKLWYLVDRSGGKSVSFSTLEAAEQELQSRINPIPGSKGWGWV